MTSDFLAPRRLEPLHEAVTQLPAVEDTVHSNDLQQDAAADNDVQQLAPLMVEDYTISVDQVREHFRTKGLSKSKDTVQRWCRTGELDCKKRGVLSRYFTTETSLSALEHKLLPDMIAEQTGQTKSSVPTLPLDAAANETTDENIQVHTPSDEPGRSSMQDDGGESAAAFTDAPVHQLDVPEHASTEIARLRAENAGLKEQLVDAKENMTFMREEVVSARGQRGDVVKIAEQMLGTLETMAIGGKLKRGGDNPSDGKSGDAEAVKFQEVEPSA